MARRAAPLYILAALCRVALAERDAGFEDLGGSESAYRSGDGSNLKTIALKVEPISHAEYGRLKRRGMLLHQVKERHFDGLEAKFAVPEDEPEQDADEAGEQRVDFDEDHKGRTFRDVFDYYPDFVWRTMELTSLDEVYAAYHFLAYTKARFRKGDKPGEKLKGAPRSPPKCESVAGASGDDPTYCTCDKGVAFCGNQEVAGHTFAATTVLRRCPDPYCASPEDVPIGKASTPFFQAKNVSDNSTVLKPRLRINPTVLSAGVCIMVDVDFGDLTLGGFTGMIELGLKGNILRNPATQCYQYQLVAMMAFGYGFTVAGQSWRIHVIMVGTLFTQERTLDSARNELQWDMPAGYNTKVCHTKNPFDLVSKTLRAAFVFFYQHVLTEKYLEHPEVRFSEVLAKHGADQQLDFARYKALLTPPSAQQDSPAALFMLNITTTWADDGILTVEVNPGVSWNSVCATDGGCTGMDFKVWIDVGPALKVEELTFQGDGWNFDGTAEWSNGRATFRVKCRSFGAVGKITVKGPGGIPLLGVPLDLNEKVNRTFDAPGYKALFLPERSDILSVQSLTARDGGGCKGYRVEYVEVKVLSRTYMWDSTYWTPDMYGAGYPWGVHVRNVIGDLGDAGVPQELKHIIPEWKVKFKLDETDIDLLTELLQEGQAKSTTWDATWQSIAAELNATIAAGPSRVAVAIVATYFLKDYITHMLHISRLHLMRTEQPLIEPLLQQLAGGSPSRQCVEEVVELNLTAEVQEQRILACGRGKRRENEDIRTIVDMQNPSGDHVWKTFKNRMPNEDLCKLLGQEMPFESIEACQSSCQKRHFWNSGMCNVVVFDGDGLCNQYDCTGGFHGFLTADGAMMAASVPSNFYVVDEFEQATAAQIVAGTPNSVISLLLSGTTDEECESPLDGMAGLPDSLEQWGQKVMRMVFWPGTLRLTSLHSLKRTYVEEFMDDLVHSDFSWLTSPELKAKIFRGRWQEGEPNARIKARLKPVGFFARFRAVKELEVEFHLAERLDLKGSRWAENRTLSVRTRPTGVGDEVETQDASNTCQLEVETSWVWQTIKFGCYIHVPNLIPPLQAVFAAFNQFASKLPAYVDQVMERLEPKEETFASSFWLTRILPYSTADGRFLHRHLDRDEEDVQVHKGELGLQDAVFNYPKAFRMSQHKDKASFWFNSGLSVANVFIRAVGDVQALMNLYFAGHPDWDGHCESLPARFNLFYEYPREWSKDRTTTWGISRIASPDNFKKTAQPWPEPPTHWAGDKISARGREVTTDERELWLSWHWISKPKWRRVRERRAGFFTQTGATKGKDAWVNENISDASAVMWPHLWCDMVSQYWLEDELVLIDMRDRAEDRNTANELDEFLSQEPNRTQYDLLSRVETVRRLFNNVAAGCPRYRDIGSFLPQLAVDFDEAIRALSDGWQFCADVLVDELQKDLTAAMNQLPNKRKDLEVVSTQLGSLAGTLEELTLLRETESITFREALFSLQFLFDPDANLSEQQNVESRRMFLQSLDSLVKLFLRKQRLTADATGELDRLLALHPRASNSRSMDEARLAYAYMDPLLTGGMRIQWTLQRRMQLLWECIEISRRPATLADERFQPWVDPGRRSRQSLLSELMFEIEPNLHADKVIGVDLFFDRACKTPLESDDPAQPRVEPRPECERAMLSKHLITLIPSLALRTIKTFLKLRADLDELRDLTDQANGLQAVGPNQTREEAMLALRNKTEAMLTLVKDFLRSLTEGIDQDFYTAFAYKQDGAGFGDMFRAANDAIADILGTLDDRKSSFTEWVRTGVEYSTELKTMRRAHVKDVVVQTEIPAKTDGCSCRNEWTAWVWTGRPWPFRRYFEGCAQIPDGTSIWGADGNVSQWTGVCRTKTRTGGLGGCLYTFAACDPAVTDDTRPKFRVLAIGGMRQTEVSLPLVDNRFFFNFNVFIWRPNFCGQNMARVTFTWVFQWSSSSWQPWISQRQSCFMVQVAPPGLAVQVMRCTRRSGEDFKNDLVGTSDWTISAKFFMIHHENVWGTKDGDKYMSWLDGSWLGKQKAAGWWAPFGGGGDWKSALNIKTWAQVDKGWGFNLDVAEVAKSGSAFWIALAAELFSTFQGPLVLDGFTGDRNISDRSVESYMTSVGWAVWQILAKWEVVPQEWNFWIGRKEMAQWLNRMAGGKVIFTPWRNHHEVVLNLRYNIITRFNTRSWFDFFPELWTKQIEALVERTVQLGAPTKELLTDFRALVGNTVQNLGNLNSEVLQHVFRVWNQTIGSFMKDDVLRLIRRCPGVPAMYNINQSVASDVTLHWFHHKTLHGWLEATVTASNGPWLMTEHADGWLMKVRALEDEARMFPPVYKSFLRVTQTLGTDFPLWPHLEHILSSVDHATLRCWVTQLLPRGGQQILQSYLDQGCMTEEDRRDIMLWGPYWNCFNHDWKVRFLNMNWASIVGSLEAMGPEVLTAFLQDFSRGDIQGIEVNPDGTGEQTQFKVTPTFQAALAFHFRLGLSYIQIPKLVHIQPVMDFLVSYNVWQLITAFRVRLLGSDNETSTVTKEHQERIDRCKACVRMPNGAYCDREWVVQAMSQNDEDIQYLRTLYEDGCVEKTELERHRCLGGIGAHRNRDAGMLFQEQMCPCFDKVSGKAIRPVWHTTLEGCADLKIADDGESLREANKATDFSLGFDVPSLDLGSELVMTNPNTTMMGCRAGFQCCGALVQGSELLRCVNQTSLRSLAWFGRATCKLFTPTDAEAPSPVQRRWWQVFGPKAPWHLVKDTWRCAPHGTGSKYGGHWSRQSSEQWSKDLDDPNCQCEEDDIECSCDQWTTLPGLQKS